MAKSKQEINLVQRPIKKYAPLFILPTFAAFCIGFVWPFIQGIYLSLCNFNTPRDAKWVGVANYMKVFSDAGFANAFKNTALFAIVSIILINVLAFTIAYALTQKMRGANLFRTVFFMPKDLTKGMRLQGTVRSVVDFGAFVDIGLKNAGMIHKSKLSKTPINHPLEIVNVGDIVDVYVIEVNLETGRVGLSFFND